MEPSVQFAEQASPSAQNHASGHNAIGGVVRLRSRTQSLGHRGSIDHAKSGDYEDAEDEDAGLRNEADYKRSQVGAAYWESVHGCVHADQLFAVFQCWPNCRTCVPIHRCNLR